jgi:hypothetical protein
VVDFQLRICKSPPQRLFDLVRRVHLAHKLVCGEPESFKKTGASADIKLKQLRCKLSCLSGERSSEEGRLQVDGQTPADDHVGLRRHQGLAARRPLVALQQHAALALQRHQLVLQQLLPLLEPQQRVVRLLEHVVLLLLLLQDIVLTVLLLLLLLLQVIGLAPLLLQLQVLLQVQRQRPRLLVDERRLRQLVVLEGHALGSGHLETFLKNVLALRAF